jgi:hypothetical protein
MRVSHPHYSTWPSTDSIRIVEYETEDMAKSAKVDLSDKSFMGRAVFIREVSQHQPIRIRI